MLQIGEGSRRALGEVLGLTNKAISLYSLAGRAGLDTDTLLYRTRTAVKHYSFPVLPSPVFHLLILGWLKHAHMALYSMPAHEGQCEGNARAT